MIIQMETIMNKSIWLLVFIILLISCAGKQDKENFKRNDNAVMLNISISGSLQNAAFAPDSSRIVFTRFRNGYNSEPADIFIFTISTGSITTLVSDNSCNVNLPGSAWVGTELVFSSSRDPHDEIFYIAENGTTGDETQITNRPDDVAYEPSFSPDGEWIVFESHELDVEDDGIIMKYEIAGAGTYIELTDLINDGDCRQPNWSPAGDLIVYQKFDNRQWDLWTMDINVDGNTKITSGPGDKTDASFSPDGSWIVYSSDENELEYANIFMIPSTGGSSIRVTNYNGYDGAPSWSPDGRKISFESYPGDPDDSAGSTIWIIDAP